MPKCSSSYTSFGASRHMNSIASWSPSQSEPLMVSYMCQSQWSSPMLPSAAPMPPCAATVWERVGNTFESTAPRKPWLASSSAARSPEPPAPTMTASNLRMGIVISAPPQDRSGPHQVEEEREPDRHLRREAHARRVQVVHEDVAHADPRMVEERGEEEQGRDPEERAREHRLPLGVCRGRIGHEAHDEGDGVGRHHDGGEPLQQPVADAVVGADRVLRVLAHHSLHATSAVAASPRTSTAIAEVFEASLPTPRCRS